MRLILVFLWTVSSATESTQVLKLDRGHDAEVRKAFPNPLCIWDSAQFEGFKCAPHSKYICAEWDRISPMEPHEGIDPYTRMYFEDFCHRRDSKGRRCVDQTNVQDCYAAFKDSHGQSEDRRPFDGCRWDGDDDDHPFGFCRFDLTSPREHVSHMASKSKHGLVGKQAQFSWIINWFDCLEVCIDTSLGLLPGHCPTLKHGCEWHNGYGMCTFNPVKIAKRYNPRLLNMAKLQQTCFQHSTWEACASTTPPS
jgi:hypothetical protein